MVARGGIVLTALLVACPLRSQTLTTLYSFSGAQGSGSTQGPVVQGPDGNFYGAIQTGGANRDGAIFRITPGGTLTTLHSFSGTDGAFPSSGVTLGSDGNFYGATWIGGPAYHSSSINEDGAGTIFKITPTGTFTVLHAFSGSDGGAPAGLTLGPDGNFYGATSGGQGYGANGGIVTYASTIFKISSTGAFSSLYTFASGIAAQPFARLTLGPDGDFYGTTASATGQTVFGMVYKVTLSGTLTSIYSFPSTGNIAPGSGLTLGSDGNFYGTTTSAGSSGTSTIFKIAPSGVVTTLFSSPNATGFTPSGGLIQGPDRNFYGATQLGGTSGDGSVFRVTPSGVLTTVYSFQGADGESPNALSVGSDGNFYGITSAGGTYNEGTVFKLDINFSGTPAPSIMSGGIVPVYSAAPIIQAGEWVSIFGINLASASATWNGDFPTSLGGTGVTIDGKAAYLWFVSPTQINLQAPDDTATGTVPVVVTTGGGSSTSTVTLSSFAPSFSLLSSRYVAAIVATSGSPGNSGAGYDIIGPAGAFAYPTRPVRAGETVQLYGVGFGPTNSPVPAGQSFSGAAVSTTIPLVTIGGVTATVTFAGIVEAGLFQFNVIVPNAGSGDQLLQATIGGMTTPNNVYLTLQ